MSSKNNRKFQEQIVNSGQPSAFDFHQQHFSSSKEKPELNPILSELINADIQKSIEAKRQISQQNVLVEIVEDSAATTIRPILATTARSKTVATSANDLLVDQEIKLDEAGSENKQVCKN